MGVDTMSHQGAETVDIVTGAVSLVFIALRLYVHGYFGRLSSSDLLIVISWGFFIGNSVTDFYQNKWGFWDPRIDYKADGKLPDFEAYIKDRNAMVKAFKMTYWTGPFYHLSLYFVKMAFLVMYLEMFPPSLTKLRKALWGSICFVTLGYVVVLCQQLLWCLPVSRNWTMDPKQRCLAWAAPTPWYYAAGFHIISDFLVYALPFFLLPTLISAASTKKIIGVGFMFSLGLLCILVTVGRLINVGKDATAAVVSAWCSAECFICIVVACILPLKRMWMAWSYRADAGSAHNSRSRSWIRSKHSLVGSRSWRKGFLWKNKRFSTRFTGDGDIEDGKGTWGLDSTRDATAFGMTSMGGTVDTEFGGLAPRKCSKHDDDITPVDSNRASAALPPPSYPAAVASSTPPKSGRWKWKWTNSSNGAAGSVADTKGSGFFGGGGGKNRKVKELGNLTFGSSKGPAGLASPSIPGGTSDTSLSPRLQRHSGLARGGPQSPSTADDGRAPSSDGEGGPGSIHSMTFGTK